MIKIYFFLTIFSLSLLGKYSLSENLNLFSARQEVLMRDIIQKFEEKENIKVNIISAKANQLINRIETEGEYTRADVLLTVDISRLLDAKNKNLFRKVDSKILIKDIPVQFRDKENFWFGFSLRSRIFVYHQERVSTNELKGYIDLMEKKWRNRILIRSSNNVYNQSLVSAMISKYGEDNTRKFLNNFKNNFSRSPSGGDRDQIRAVLAGEGDLAVVNSYYYIKMKSDDKENNLKDLKIHFPSDNIMKTHMNVSGAGIIKYSKNYNNALKFLEYLASNEAQKLYAELNFEYPVREDIKLSKFMSSYKAYEKDDLNLNKIADYNRKAIFMMGEAGWK